MSMSENISNDVSSPEVDSSRRLRDYFENAGALVDSSDRFREDYLLDFTVTALEDVHAHVNLGIHVTTESDDLEQQKAFFQASKRGVVLKSLYIEVDDVTINSGGLLVAFGACLSFLFDRRYSQVKAMGIRIFEDCSFHFFDLEENIERLERMSIDDELTIGEDIRGRIIAYFTDKGFGFIQTEEERKFFFHIANVVDDELRTRLPSYVPGEIIPVEFQYGGHDGKKYPKAINVAMREEDEQDE
ncbi:MAG: cold-shock protein [Persicimonas sp.]